MNDHFIRLESVSKAFGPVQALRSVSLDADLSTGVVLAVWGENGAGKSTLLSLIGGLSRPDRGKVSVFGSNPSSQPFRSFGRIGFLLQSSLLYGDLTVRDNLQLATDLKGAAAGPYASLCRRFGLDTVMHRRVRDCSPGMIKRTSLVRALIGEPELIIFDEPFSAIDLPMQEDLIALILELKTAGRSVLLATHRVDVLRRLADRVLILRRGELIQDLRLAGISRDSLTLDRLGCPPPRDGGESAEDEL